MSESIKVGYTVMVRDELGVHRKVLVDKISPASASRGIVYWVDLGGRGLSPRYREDLTILESGK